MANSCYLDVNQIQEITGLGESKSYSIIKELNDELASKGFIIIRGRVPKRYFIEKSGLTIDEIDSALGIKGAE